MTAQVIVCDLDRGPKVKPWTFQEHLQYLHRNTPARIQVQGEGEENKLRVLQQQGFKVKLYEMMEADTRKYSQYEEALKAAMTDLVEEADQERKELVVILLEAGRGQLLKVILTASEKTRRKVRVIAVEENPGALVSLQQLHRESCWGEDVKIISSVTGWSPASQDHADILVTELVGSETLPEHLAKARKFLKPGGVCIPTSYVTYLAPLQSSKLYSQVRQLEKEKQPGKHPLASYESLYSVKLKVSSNSEYFFRSLIKSLELLPAGLSSGTLQI